MISVVLPVPPRAARVAETVEACVRDLENLGQPFEVLLVAAGAASVAQCNSAASGLAQVRVVEIGRWRWGTAVRTGLDAAKGDVLCYANADETSAWVISLMLAYALSHPGLVFKVNRRSRASVARRIGSLLYNVECRALLGVHDWDVNGTPKIFPRSCTRLLQLSRDDELIDVEFLLVCQEAGYRLLQVPVVTKDAHARWPTTSPIAALAMFRKVVGMRDRYRRDGV